MRRSIVLQVLLSVSIVRAESRAPVAIVSPTVYTPAEMAGSGVAPAVAVEVKVDDRGRVAAVSILSIRPSTRFDALVGTTVTDALSRWRYAPATEDGRPVGATLKWEIQFVARGQDPVESDPRSPFLGSTDIAAIEEDARRWERYLESLPRGEFEKVRAEHARAAEALLVPERRQEATTEHFVVATDMPQPGTARRIAGNLEAAFGSIYKLVGARIPPLPQERPILVFTYSSEQAFLELARKLELGRHAAGVYVGTGILAFHLEVDASEIALHIMLHEAAHAFLHQTVARYETDVPTWLDEGFAEYVGNSDVVEGKIVPGSHKPYTVYHAPGLARRDRSMSLISAKLVRDALGASAAVTVRDLVTIKPSRFYGEKYDLYYAQSWLLVHFLRHGEPRWAEGEFPRFLLYVAEGFGAEEALASVYGKTWEALDAEYRDYVRKF